MKKIKIEEIDQNFLIKDATVKQGTKIYNALDYPFSVHGVLPPTNEQRSFHRMNANAAARVSDAVNALNIHCAGGRIRFKTNSSYIAVRAILTGVGKMSHFALTGSAGFDLYSGCEHIATFQPKFDLSDELFGEHNAKVSVLREYTLNLPLYSGVKELYIILDENAVVQGAAPYKNDKPIVFYGSSITQGGCASRPGTTYSAILSRRLNLDYVNLGFSGSAKGEQEIADYIAGLDMCAFVFDYDHNASSVEYLKKTHEKFFSTVREAHPHIPIICLSQPFPCSTAHNERASVIESTVLNAIQNGDKNACFIHMSDYLKNKGVLNECSVDRCHPNDLGFYLMAEALEKEMGKFFV